MAPLRNYRWFITQLDIAVKNKDVISSVVRINNETAQQLLDAYNFHNRAQRRGTVKQYAVDMVEGRWQSTGVPIIFSDKRRLIDGQHRLAALVHAADSLGRAVEIEISVTFGIQDAAFQYIDNNLTRSAKDYATIAELPAPEVVGPATRFIANYDHRKYAFTSSVRNLGTTEADVYAKNAAAIDDALCLADVLSTMIPALYAPKLLALMVIMRRIDADACDAFFTALSHAQDEDSNLFGNTRLRLREIARRGYANPNSEIFAIVSYAWRCYYHGNAFDPLAIPSRMTDADRFDA